MHRVLYMCEDIGRVVVIVNVTLFGKPDHLAQLSIKKLLIRLPKAPNLEPFLAFIIQTTLTVFSMIGMCAHISPTLFDVMKQKRIILKIP